MTDVSSWSPVDESNTAAPPDGWPEFMMPSGVNNCGRMMMGAVRRMYDQQISGTIVLPYLKLSGGTVSGTVTVTGSVLVGASVQAAYLVSTGNASIMGSLTASSGITTSSSVNAASYDMSGSHFASSSGASTQLYDRANTVCIGLDNSIGLNTYSNNQHDFNGRGGSPNWVKINSSGILVSAGGINVPAGNITASSVTATGSLTGNDLWVGGMRVRNVTGRWYFDNEIYDTTGIWVGSECAVVPTGINYKNTGVGIAFTPSAGGPNTDVFHNGGYQFTIAASSSDTRLKTDIAPADVDALSLVRQLDTIQFKMYGRYHAVGVRGQQLDELMSDAVVKGPADAEVSELIQVDPLAFSSYLLRALQQLADKVDVLEAGGL